MRTSKQRLLICALSACVTVLTFETYAAEGACDRVSLDSVEGVVGIRHERIEELATSHGLHGLADFVIVKPPRQPSGPNKIRRIVLMADLSRSFRADCHTGPDITNKQSIICAESVPSKGLKLIVTYEPDSARDLEAQTNALVKYVSDDVLNCRLDYL